MSEEQTEMVTQSIIRSCGHRDQIVLRATTGHKDFYGRFVSEAHEECMKPCANCRKERESKE
jgi:hypothetical protein